MAEELVISSTTDPQQVVEGAVQRDLKAGVLKLPNRRWPISENRNPPMAGPSASPWNRHKAKDKCCWSGWPRPSRKSSFCPKHRTPRDRPSMNRGSTPQSEK